MDEYGCELPNPLWRLHRKDPGWVVGEHIQVRRCGLLWRFFSASGGLWTVAMERLGETERWSREKRTEEEALVRGLYRLTRVGEADLWKKVEEREVKLEEEEAKAVEDDGRDGEE